MEPRKTCVTCGEYLIVFQGNYLHPEKPCQGVLDYIEIEGRISDEIMHKKFIKIYGEPKINDSERLTLIEKNPLIKLILKFIYRKK